MTNGRLKRTKRILIADDHRMISDGLKALIDMETHMDVVDIAVNGREAVDLSARLKPDVVIMDIRMPVMDGIESTLRIRHECPSVKVIMLSAFRNVQYVLDAFYSGASGYILKEHAFREITRGITVVLAGKTYLCSNIVSLLCEEYANRIGKKELQAVSAGSLLERKILQQIGAGIPASRIAFLMNIRKKRLEDIYHDLTVEHILPQLISISRSGPSALSKRMTRREQDILVCLNQEKSNKEIADALGISQDTVKYHLKKIFAKFEVANRYQAIALARRDNIVDH